MKKILLIAIVLMTGNFLFAQNYSFEGLVASDFTNLSTNGTLGVYAMDGVDAPAISYTSPDYMTFTAKGVNFRYKNSGNKTNIIKCGATFLQTDGKNVEILLSGLTVGQQIRMTVTAKGATNSIFSATGATINSPVEATTGISNAAYVEVVMTIDAADVIIKETNGGFRIKSLTIGNFSLVENIFAEKGVSFNGKMLTNDKNITLKLYNVAGQEVIKSNSTIDMTKYAKGIYMVYADGVSSALKFMN